MVQGISGTYGVYGTQRAYAAYPSYSVGYTARVAGRAGGGPVEQLDPIIRATKTTAPVMVQTATKQSAAPTQAMAAGTAGAAGAAAQAQPIAFSIPDAANNKYTAAEMAVRSRIRPFEDTATMAQNKAAAPETIKADGMEKLNEDTECQTCKERKYQDESGDSSVSFQSPQTIDSAVLASTVRGHEMEHVYHEQAKAAREGRKVVSQSVTLHTAICPDCGETYVSGGTTKTVTMADNNQTLLEQQAEQQAKEEVDDPFLTNMRLPA